MEILTRPKRDALPKPPEGRAVYKSGSSFSIYPVIEESVLPYGYSQGSLIDALSAYSQKTDRTKVAARTPQPPSAVASRTGGGAAAMAGMTSQPRSAIGLDDSMCLSVSHAWTNLKRQSSAGRYTVTDRSSVSSGVSVDDFDREASAKMQLLFDDIDSVLFERQDTVELMAGNIYQECRHWNFAFPHLRVLGRQLIASRETGFEVVPASSSASAVATAAAAAGPYQAFGTGPQMGSTVAARLRSDYIRSSDSGGDSTPGAGHGRLTVEGKQVAAVLPLDKLPGISADDVSRLAEEVIDQEGCYEEIIAVDDGCTEPNCRAQEPTCKGYGGDIECSLHPHDKRLHPAAATRSAVAVVARRQRGRSTRYPPVTPAACAKDSVDDAVFSALWQAVTATLRPLLARYAQTFALLPLTVPERDRGLLPGAGNTSLSPAALHYDLLLRHRHRGGANSSTVDANRLPLIHSQPASRAERHGSATAFAASMAARLSSMQISAAMPLSRQRWSSGGGSSGISGSSIGGSSSHPAVLHGMHQGAIASGAAAGGGSSGAPESRVRLGSILTISKMEMQARDRHGDELDGGSVRADSSMRLDQAFTVHQELRKESNHGGSSSGHVAAIVAHMNTLAAAGQSKKFSGSGSGAAGTGSGGSAAAAAAATAAALSIIAAGNRRSRLTPLPDRSLTPYADEAGMQHGSVALSLQRLHMTGKKIASPLMSSQAVVGSNGVALAQDSRVGGSMLPPLVNQVIDPQGFEPSGSATDPRSILPFGFKSPTPPLSSLGAARSTIRRKFTDRIGSAIAASEKVPQQPQHFPSPLQQHGLRDKHAAAATAVSSAAAAAATVVPAVAASATAQRPNTTHGLGSTRVNIQFAGSSSRVPFTPIGISPLAKAGSLHNVTYRRGNKVLNPFAR